MNVIEILEIKKAIELISKALREAESKDLEQAKDILEGLIEFKDIALDKRWPYD